MEIKKTTRLTMLLSISVVLSIVESFIPILNGIIPGVKIGLSNVVVLIVLYLYGINDAFKLSILRVILVGILRTGLFSITFFFSLFGAFLSILGMAIVKKTKLSIIGVSVIGSISHIIGQILAASIFLKNFNLIYYLPFLIIIGIITGIIVGFISKECINYLEESY